MKVSIIPMSVDEENFKVNWEEFKRRFDEDVKVYLLQVPKRCPWGRGCG